MKNKILFHYKDVPVYYTWGLSEKFKQENVLLYRLYIVLCVLIFLCFSSFLGLSILDSTLREWASRHQAITLTVAIIAGISFVLILVNLIVIIIIGISRVKLEDLTTTMSTGNIQDVMDEVDVMDGHSFEHYVKNLLLKSGFNTAKVTKGSGDQGVDIIATRGEDRYAIQCKRYTANVNNKAVQEAFAGKAFWNCNKCMVITNSYMTPGGIAMAKKCRCEIIDRNILRELILRSSKNITNEPSPIPEDEDLNINIMFEIIDK